MNIQQPLKAYLQGKQAASKQTAKTYGAGLRSWLAWAEEQELEPVSTEGVRGFLGSMLARKGDEKLSNSTILTYMAAVLGFLDYLNVLGLEPDVNTALVRHELRNVKQPPSWERVVALDDLRKKQMPEVVAWFEHYAVPEENDRYNHRLIAMRNAALFWTLYETAGRIGEVRRINRKMIQPDTTKVTVVGKGVRPHVLRFGFPVARAVPALLAYFAERDDRSPAAFVAHSRNSSGVRMSKTSISTTIKKAMMAAGASEDLTPHDIRHYRAATLLKQDVPLHVIQTVLNHQDIGTTRDFYAPVTDEEDVRRHLAALRHGE